MQASVSQGRALLSLAERALVDLSDDHLAREPAPGCKTAGWLVGHLAVTGDFGRRLCGRPPLCPKEWRAAFNPGTTPSADPAIYPSMHALRTSMLDVYGDLGSAALGASAELLASENPYAPTRKDFPTSGDFVAYLLAGHFAYHLGQLAVWRAAAGLQPLSRVGAGAGVRSRE
jgi:hypothetical protein